MGKTKVNFSLIFFFGALRHFLMAFLIEEKSLTFLWVLWYVVRKSIYPFTHIIEWNINFLCLHLSHLSTDYWEILFSFMSAKSGIFMKSLNVKNWNKHFFFKIFNINFFTIKIMTIFLKSNFDSKGHCQILNFDIF